MEFEPVIGLEIHIQLNTKSKAFSSDSTEYGALPNTHVSAISLGHPGTLPMHNKQAVDQAIKLGIALHCEIEEWNKYARKNYFYADLPKGYQITQFDTPICNNGRVPIKLKTGETKNIGLIRIHMEEDTGKSMHDQDLNDTLIDFNRCGTPLLEIVSQPEIKNGDEAFAFVTEVRRLVRYLEICDGNMEEGSMRCDANISIMPKGSSVFGTKVEVKNMNSISNVKRAIDFEIERQKEIILKGEKVMGETRGFNGLNGSTFSMRKKELVNDYRYFPEPDLPPLRVSQDYIETIKHKMPTLPEELYNQFTQNYFLTEYDANVLVDDKATALYFQELIQHTTNYKAAANWVTVNIRAYLNEAALNIENCTIDAKKIAEIIALIDNGTISNSAANQLLFPAIIKSPEKAVNMLVDELNIAQNSDASFIETLADEVLAAFPEKVLEYKNGKVGLLGLFVGELMKKSKGKADPKMANSVLLKKLE